MCVGPQPERERSKNESTPERGAKKQRKRRIRLPGAILDDLATSNMVAAQLGNADYLSRKLFAPNYTSLQHVVLLCSPQFPEPTPRIPIDLVELLSWG